MKRIQTEHQAPMTSLPTSGTPATRPLTGSIQPGERASKVHIRSARQRSGTLLLDLPISARLTLSFLIGAFIAASVTGVLGLLRVQSLGQQSAFYQKLLQTNTQLTTGAQFLQVMHDETNTVLALALSPQSSDETIKNDITATKNLASGYDTIIKKFVDQDLLKFHDDQVAIVQQANQGTLVKQQETLAASALRTWGAYHSALEQVLQDIANGDLAMAQQLNQISAEPTNADALSAVHALTLFNNRLAKTVQEAAAALAQQQWTITIISAAITFVAILLIGWLISGTLVQRLRLLRRVTQAVEQGELTRRVNVVGRDEIADVSASVNAMLDEIVRLLNETRSQRDALANAAEHLFSNMRVVSSGDLRVSAPVTNDPIGMLANAFNFTVGRFRRFVLRIKIVTEQIDGLARRGLERADVFTQALDAQKHGSRFSQASVSSSEEAGDVSLNGNLVVQLRSMREHLHRLTNEDMLSQSRAVVAQAEQVAASLDRLNKLAGNSLPGGPTPDGGLAYLYARELRTLDPLLKHLLREVQNVPRTMLKELQELDKEMDLLGAQMRSARLRGSGTKSNQEPQASSAFPDSSQDFIRLSSTFAADVIAMEQQLLALSKEIRKGIVAFQFEGTENTTRTS